jgi:dimethylamine--corrinoid protein Co-methyltransferase
LDAADRGKITPLCDDEQKHLMVAPVFYGAMPNLGLYTQPDGPVPNPAELLPQGKIKEAREAYDGAIEHAVRDMVYVATSQCEAVADGINFDTVGASGDPAEVGMAGEFVLGMHGEMTHNGVRLAGLYPHNQVKIAQDAGVDIFGPAINTVSTKSIP